MSEPIKNSGEPANSLGQSLKDKGFNPLYLLAGVPVVMLFGFCMCCGMCSIFSGGGDRGGGGASTASTSGGEDNKANNQTDGEVRNSIVASEKEPSLADGPIPFSTFENYSIDLLSKKGGYDVSGTGLAGLKDTRLQVTLGAIQYSTIETILVVIVHDSNDNVVMVQLNFSVDVDRDFDKATATFQKASELFRYSVFPNESEEVRQFFLNESANIHLGNGAKKTFGKATLTAKARGDESLYTASLNLDDYKN